MYLLAVLMAAAMPFTSMAQDDDLYFNPKKEAKEKAERKAALLREYKACLLFSSDAADEL